MRTFHNAMIEGVQESNLELVAFVKPFVPLIDPVEDGVEWSQNKTVPQ